MKIMRPPSGPARWFTRPLSLKQCCFLLYGPVMVIMLIMTLASDLQSPAAHTNYASFTIYRHSRTNVRDLDDGQVRRKQRLHEFCRTFDGAKKIKLPDETRLITNYEKSLAYCHVPKAASTTWMVAFARMNQLPDYANLVQRARLHNELLVNYGTDWNLLPDETFKFTFLRHPFHRLVSAYNDKFVVKQEQNFIQPVIDWHIGLLPRLLNLWRIVPANATSDFQMNFEKFVKFVIHEVESNTMSYGSLHWWPYTRLCDLCKIPFDFIGKVETLASDMNVLAKSGRFSTNIQELASVKFNENEHKTETVAKLYFKQLSKDLVQRLYSIYKADFLIGGYDYPKHYLDLART